jgi:RNA polymerase-associated protein CTR9
MMLASLRAHPRPGVSSADATKERERARELFDIVYKALELHTDRPPINGNGVHKLSRAYRRLGEDVDVHAEIARLWQAEDLGRAKRALREGVRIGEASTQGQADPRLMNNLGAILHLEGDYAEARRLYEGALTLASKEGIDRDLAEGVSTTVLYNLARSYEALGLDLMAKEAYEKLLSRHPEYVDGKSFLNQGCLTP